MTLVNKPSGGEILNYHPMYVICLLVNSILKVNSEFQMTVANGSKLNCVLVIVWSLLLLPPKLLVNLVYNIHRLFIFFFTNL